ncbi:hypothetical protein M8756_07045 [Lutimaribacter sp. EGI FJ00015]|uniref:Uncharacterized protein n=1 Tax=Lutimaribacter degradans TaxID=2945989 RepID=A0ACC5ZU99_9RHOB|nr:hypothetical protein [Lutimaribacter sp. EGI FJ00013]MCM2561907.1 hypothetical protein [Lutimaribacter sp. EGI FJ00013]MCO0613061.1 hypothetical protein [Lutimaribacter sp. EGI FJ00015]MCO0635739.1 hypothetical protein [Lutimaribacter sp. EGI FJ00014]
MIRRLCSILLFFSLFPTAVAAQQAIVRSGEHGDFTRLVVGLPRGAEWEIQKAEKRVILQIGSGVTSFDLSSVFQRIDRSRVASVSAGNVPGQLIIDIGCNCSAKAFLAGPRMLALDIAPMPIDAGQQADATGPVSKTLSFGSAVVQVPRMGLQMALPDFPSEGGTNTTGAIGMFAEKMVAIELAGKAEERLLRQLGRAATQGLLAPNAGIALRSASTRASSQPSSKTFSKSPRLQTDIPLVALSSQDADFLGAKGSENQTMGGADCIPDDDFSVVDWGADSFHAGLSHWRGQLFGDLDQINEDAALGLAKHYIHYGFGAEARQSLRLQDKPEPLLEIMSHLVDGDPVADPGSLPAQASCEGLVSLWAVLSAEEGRQPTDVNHKAVVRHFAALPRHLRLGLGPDLAMRLAGYGHEEASELILRRMDLAADRKTQNQALAEIGISKRAADQEKAQKLRKVAVAQNTEQSPMALAAIIESEVAAGRPIPGKTAELAAAFAFENRSGENADILAWADALAHAGAGQFALALSKLDALDPENIAARPARIYALLRTNAPDALFLELIFQRLDQAKELPEDEVNRLAERVLLLGFPEDSMKLLMNPAGGDEARERRLLRAEAALKMTRPRQAEAELLGFSGPDVDAIRARARSMAGDHAIAARVYADLESEGDGRRSAFLASEWADLAQTDDPALSAFAALKLTENEATPNEAVLARNQDLLDQSARVRETLDQLISSFAFDDSANNSDQAGSP